MFPNWPEVDSVEHLSSPSAGHRGQVSAEEDSGPTCFCCPPHLWVTSTLAPPPSIQTICTISRMLKCMKEVPDQYREAHLYHLHPLILYSSPPPCCRNINISRHSSHGYYVLLLSTEDNWTGFRPGRAGSMLPSNHRNQNRLWLSWGPG